MSYTVKRHFAPLKVDVLVPLVLVVAGIFAVVSSVAAAGPGIKLGPNNTSRVSGGHVVTYSHILTNTGDISDTIVVAASSAHGWRVNLASGVEQGATSLVTYDLGISQTVTLQLSVTIPVSVAGIVDVTMVTATSQLSPTVYGTAVDTTTVPWTLYLPVVYKHWPPLPYRPTLNSIYDPDNAGTYLVSWSVAALADTYSLEEDDNPLFLHPVEVYRGYETYWQPPTSRLSGTYYYRVRGCNSWGLGEVSNVASVLVLAPATPILSPIDNSDQDNSYKLIWDNAARATSYVVQEAITSTFASATVIGTFGSGNASWLVSNKIPNTYYYRIAAVGPTGTSGWSNPQRVTIHPLFVGLSLRWDGNGYVRTDEYFDVGVHYTASFRNLIDPDTIRTQWNIWYDPNPKGWSPSQYYEYDSVSTGYSKSSSVVNDPAWKWGDWEWLGYDDKPVSGNIFYIGGQAFKVSGPYQGYTAFGKAVSYWQLVNRDKFLMWDGGTGWTQYVHAGEAVLWYDAGNTRVELYSNVKRHYYYNGSLTSYTVQYIKQLTSANCIGAGLTGQVAGEPREPIVLLPPSKTAAQTNRQGAPMPQGGTMGNGKWPK
jgi:hypothetical protein